MKKWIAVALLALAPAACKKSEKKAEPAPAAEPAKPAEPAATEATKPAEPAAADPAAADPAAASPLAALALSGQMLPADGIVTGGQVTDEQLAKAKELGVKTVINLRAEAEKAEFATEEAKAKELGLAYHHISVDSKTGDGLTPENAKKFAELVSDANKPMVVHCKSGQRVGAMFAYKAAVVDGKSADEALAEGAKAGLTKPELIEVVKQKIAAAAPAK